MDVKQVIIMRKDLGMRKGKMIAQGAHASMKVIVDQMVTDNCLAILKIDSCLNKWLNGLFTKVVLGVDSENELLDLYYKAKLIGIPCALTTDAGFTEFHGEVTNTCVAIGPAENNKIDLITGSLKLL